MAVSATGRVYEFPAGDSYVTVRAVVPIQRCTAEDSPWICGETIKFVPRDLPIKMLFGWILWLHQLQAVLRIYYCLGLPLIPWYDWFIFRLHPCIYWWRFSLHPHYDSVSHRFVQGFSSKGSPLVHCVTVCVQVVSRDLSLEFQPEVQCCISDAGCVKGFCPRNSGFAPVTVFPNISLQWLNCWAFTLDWQTDFYFLTVQGFSARVWALGSTVLMN